jgi:hypothetical protein
VSKKKEPVKKSIETLVHDDEKRLNIPTAEMEPLLQRGEAAPIPGPMNAQRLALMMKKPRAIAISTRSSSGEARTNWTGATS